MSVWVSGNEKRIFINTSLRCSAKCLYCYLPYLGIESVSSKSADEVIDELYCKSYFVPGRQGTILSIGCYSECWDEENKEATKKLLNTIVKTENYIQFATKKEIRESELEYLNSIAQFNNQIVINVSVPTISQSRQFEKGTDSIEKRLSFLKYKSNYMKLCFSLYIKPVIDRVTIRDVHIYNRLFEDNKDLYCVLGSMLKPDTTSQEIKIGIHNFRECPVEDEDILYEEIGKVCKVFRHSVDLINDLRGIQGEV